MKYRNWENLAPNMGPRLKAAATNSLNRVLVRSEAQRRAMEENVYGRTRADRRKKWFAIKGKLRRSEVAWQIEQIRKEQKAA